ncbi:subtilisin-like protease SBT1.1 [Canna indica]|uniref:Subtilisin-like protease SBT1.1 n=1 Tax=Canna indica TaxID=4628 RepID=A0AAQ3QIF2_9LILI|nr:subtilisin-like protease SBT1.1 [Canna indica]
MKTSNASWVSLIVVGLVASLTIPSTVFCRPTPDHNADHLQTYIIQVKTPVQSMDSDSLKICLRASITLGNGKKINAESVDQSPKFPKSSLPLFYGSSCFSLSATDVEGGVAVIFMNTANSGNTIVVNSFNFPTAIVSSKDGSTIQSYATSSSDPTATISFDGAVLGISPAPTVASFSSRGPSQAVPSIIKPDISGPGSLSRVESFVEMAEGKPKSQSEVWSTVKPFVNGGASGMLATCIILPIDMVKGRGTSSRHPLPSFPDSVRIQLGQGSAIQVTKSIHKLY